MITAVVGAGGKTTLIHTLARQYHEAGKKVFVTTSTHMLIEPDTLLTDDSEKIIAQLNSTNYVMAGLPEGIKITALSYPAYLAICSHADEVLIEADGSKHHPIKLPIAGEPVIWDNVDHIIVVFGLHALHRPARDVAFRLDAVKACLKITDDTMITSEHIETLLQEGYLKPLKQKYPDKTISVYITHNESAEQKELAQKLMTFQCE